MPPLELLALFVTGLVAGFVDSIAGGGGLITLPVLLSFGLSPQDALGTNKLQGTFGSGSAAWHYARAGVVEWSHCWRGFILALIGGGLGALAVRSIAPDLLRRAIPLLLVVVAVYVASRPALGANEVLPRMARGWFDVIFGLAIGFYDGFFGPGTGTFWAMAYMLGLGYNMTRATGSTKVMNLASNLSSLTMFLIGGHVLFLAGGVMAAGQLIGARFGSRMVVAKGTRFIRPIFLAVVVALCLKLLVDLNRS